MKLQEDLADLTDPADLADLAGLSDLADPAVLAAPISCLPSKMPRVESNQAAYSTPCGVIPSFPLSFSLANVPPPLNP